MKRILIVGPFASEYSIAKVNRSLAFNLSKITHGKYEVKLYSNPEFTDKLPDKNTYAKYPFLRTLTTDKNFDDDIVIFYNFPKSIFSNYGLTKLKGSVKIGYIAWEESIYPEKLVKECNENLHAIATISNHVKQVFRRSGINIAMRNIGHGLDIPFAESQEYPIKSKAKFRIFHNSSGQYRKGLDILVKAYFETFTKKDDVVLILKMFPNLSIDKKTLQMITNRSANAPEVEVIMNPDMSDGELKYLIDSCDLHVYPTRAEGFGLPIAEALALGKPTITTNYSGQIDFANDSNAFMLNYKLMPSKSHLNIPGSLMAEPNILELKKFLRLIYENPGSKEILEKAENAKKLIDELTWEKVSKNMLDFVEEVQTLASLKDKKISILTRYNSQCGIATYSQDLYPKVIKNFKDFKVFANIDISKSLEKDPGFLSRTWQTTGINLDKTVEQIVKNNSDYTHIQYNSSYYSPAKLSETIESLLKNNVKVLLTIHSMNEGFSQIVPSLKKVNLIFVHSESERDFLISLGIIDNVKIVKHGLPNFPDSNSTFLKSEFGFKQRKVIATHGMIHDKKGFLELTKAVSLLKKDFPDIILLLITAINPENSTSKAYYNKIVEFIKSEKLENNVVLFTDFLETPVIIKLLQSADLLILPYAELKEGASGAVKYCLASKRPLLITDSYIFSDINFLDKLPDNNPETLANAISNLLSNPTKLNEIESLVRKFNKDFDWEDIAIDYLKKVAKI